MNVLRFDKDDVNNGPGVRGVLWVAGCDHYCEGCHNSQTWDFNAGLPFYYKDEFYNTILNYAKQDYVEGITITGGDPLNKKSINMSFVLGTDIKALGKSVWVYTGYTYDQLREKYDLSELSEAFDVIIEGPFLKDLKVDNEYRGSSNQRYIDVLESSKAGVMVEKEVTYY